MRLLLRAFFREIEVVGAQRVPLDRGGLFLSWHPNALIDPTLILIASPRPVAFGARHGLLRWPLLGTAMRALGTVPIYRAADLPGRPDDGRREANRQSLEALAARVAAGAFSGLFPEGVSHDEPHLLELKSGAARLYYRARQLTPAGHPPPAIVPVGLHYDHKRVFRSRAVVWFHEPLELPAELDVTPREDEPPECGRARARELTERIGAVLNTVVHATDDWTTRHLLNRARKLWRAERALRAGRDPGPPGAGERAAGMAVAHAAHVALLAADRPEAEALRERVRRYDEELRALRLDDHHLDRAPPLLSPWLALLLVLQAAVVFLLLPPLLLLGFAVNAPTALLVAAIARLGARQGKDLASLKLLAGAVLYPLTWVGVGLLAALGWRELTLTFPALPGGPPWLTGLVLAACAALGGFLSLRYLQAARETARAVRVRLTRRSRKRTVERLLRERGGIYDDLLEWSRTLGLPDVRSLLDSLPTAPPAPEPR